MIEVAAALAAGIALLALFGGPSLWTALLRLIAAGRTRTERISGRAPCGTPGPVAFKRCPLCSTRLERGQYVKSVVFAGGARNRCGSIIESRSHIFGCPHCWPVNAAHTRVCPYCRAPVPPGGFVIARWFDNRESGRKSVHVLGCTGCRPNYRG